ncbi:hypothetical protein Tco_1382760 [Tanacetum coccineum]
MYAIDYMTYLGFEEILANYKLEFENQIKSWLKGCCKITMSYIMLEVPEEECPVVSGARHRGTGFQAYRISFSSVTDSQEHNTICPPLPKKGKYNNVVVFRLHFFQL